MTIAIMSSGRTFDVAKPHPSMVHFADLGAHLAKLCRFHGAPAQFYSEAQHAVIVAGEAAKLDGPLAALYGLLHNADRAFDCGDELTRANVRRVIHEALDLDWPAPGAILKAVAQVHARVDLSEKQQLLAGRQGEADQAIRAGIWPLRFIIKPLTWDRALDRWIETLRSNAIAANIPHLASLAGLL